jgi:hypothetical protein
MTEAKTTGPSERVVRYYKVCGSQIPARDKGSFRVVKYRSIVPGSTMGNKIGRFIRISEQERLV